MREWAGWLIAGLLVALGAGLVVWHFMRGRSSDALKASVDMMTAWHAQDVAVKQRRIEALQQDFEANADQIDALQADLATKREQLDKKYKDSGLTADEIAERFSRISL